MDDFYDGDGVILNVGHVECLHETEKAVLCRIDGKEVWFPKSQISPDSPVPIEGDEGDLWVTEWIAEQEGIEGDPVEDGDE